MFRKIPDINALVKDAQKRLGLDENIEPETYIFPQYWMNVNGRLENGLCEKGELTIAYTAVMCSRQRAVVYFDGEFAYEVSQ